MMNILIVAFEEGRWGPARLPKPLSAAGFRVAALCPAHNPLAKTRYIARHFLLTDVQSSRIIAAGLAEAIEAWRPDLIIPADERVVACLHAFVRDAENRKKSPLTAAHIATIVRSLGDPAAFDAMLLKNRTIDVAREAGVAVPAGASVESAAAAQREAGKIGYPVFLKTPFSWAGQGVIQCRDAGEIATAFAAMRPRRRLPFHALLKRLIHRGWYPTGNLVDVQQAIDGKPAMYCAVAVAGKLVAGFAGIAQRTAVANGPSTVVWIGAHPEMEQAAAAMIAALGATGFIGFDFMIETSTGKAYLLECNPRPIQVCHLGARIGVDLCAALAAELNGRPRPGQSPTGAEIIELYPQSRQSGQSGYGHYLDIPIDDPALISCMLETI